MVQKWKSSLALFGEPLGDGLRRTRVKVVSVGFDLSFYVHRK